MTSSGRATTVTFMTDERPAWLIPLDEWQAINADLPPSDTSPLTADELAKLRTRLNAPGGARIKLSLREHTAYYEMGVIRFSERITALLDQVRREARADPRHGLAYPRGIIDAVNWATGKRREAPITGDLSEGEAPQTVEIEREERAALEVLEGRRDSIHPRDYVTGVEATLMWLRAGCDDPPW